MIALITKYGQGTGIGHLKRMEVLNNFLLNKNITSEILNINNLHHFNNIDLAILDAREVEEDIINTLLTKNIPTISLDDTETEKPSIISVLSLPYLKTKGPKPNFKGEKFLIINPEIQKTEPQKEEFDILITFGGEDPNNLTSLFLNNFNELIKDKKTALLLGPLFKNKEEVKKLSLKLGIKVYENENIYTLISSSKIIVSSFGITTYESLVLGKKVILLNNSKYHHKLFKKSHLRKYGVEEIGFLKDGTIIKTKQKPSTKNICKLDLIPEKNLERWLKIVNIALESKTKDLKDFANTKVIDRTPKFTTFLKNGKIFKINFSTKQKNNSTPNLEEPERLKVK